MFNVVTISREYGSGGGMIAEMPARRVGWRLANESLVAEVAKRAKINPETAARFDECVEPWFHGLVKSLWRGGYEGVTTSADTSIIDSEAMTKIAGEIIHEAAMLDQCVIVGRGSPCLLRHHKDAFHVSVFGPHHEKIQRLRGRMEPSADVERVMDQMDRRRAAYIHRHFGNDWKVRRLFHLVISSGLGPEAVINTIICAAGLTPETS